VLALDGGGCFRPDGINSACQRLFLLLSIPRLIRSIDVFTPVLLLLDTNDIGRTLVAGEQILAVLGVEEFSKSLAARDDRTDTCLAAPMKNGVPNIVPGSLFTQLHLEPLAEKINKTVARV